MANLVELQNISKSFGSLTAIDKFSVHLAAGEALGVVGPNGAGKSTMFNIISGDLKPDDGRVLVNGRDVTSTPAHQRCQMGIGRSYQIPHPFAKMTVFENLLVGAAFGASRAEAACYDDCHAILVQTGLLAKANMLAASLTLLERKRLEMARALATKPRVLLLDEIAGGLTEHECGALVETIQGIHEAGVSIIWIEHVVRALLSVVGRIVVINFGRQLAEGPPRKVMASAEVQEVYMGINAE